MKNLREAKQVAESKILRYSSPIGELVVEAKGGVVSALSIGGVSGKSDGKSDGEVNTEALNAPFLTLFKLFDEYFRGELMDFSGVEVAFKGTPFQRRVWQGLRTIPYGETVTYGELAAEVGVLGGARAVGSACAKNPLPIIVPCHRVLGAGGALGGYSAGTGVELKRWLLKLEGLII